MSEMMKDKVCVVTGANAGIGKVTALALAKMGAVVVMVCRNRERGETAQAELRAASGNRNVDLILADLSSFDSIRRFAEVYQARYDRLDVLVNNAGAFYDRHRLSPDGIELTFALNHLGYFLPTLLLLDVIRNSAPARIINVSSDAHRGATIDFNNIRDPNGYSGFKAYGQSKLANVLFTYELVRRLDNPAVAVNALHPGFVASNFGRNNGRTVSIAMRALSVFARSPEKGAETPIYLASSTEVEGVTGKYFVDCRAVDSSPESYDEALAGRLWEESLHLTGLPSLAVTAGSGQN